MKAKFYLFVILINLLGFSQVKADTIYVSLPGTNVAYCQDDSNYDTFIFLKPFGFGSTVWRVNGVIVSTGDSLVYVPTSAGEFQIRATWNGNIEQILLTLFSTPPPHAIFSIGPFDPDDGIINNTNDTIWMCDIELRISSNTIGSEATSWGWHWPGMANYFDDPIIVNSPGEYYFERINSCGVTRDTFQLIKAPTLAPLWADSAFCNQAVNLTLDPGYGWNYNWSESPNMQNMSNGNSTVPATSSILFFDSGGGQDNYSSNELLTHTFTSSNGNPVTLTFSGIETELGYDSIIVYDGPNSSSPVLDAFAGLFSNPIVTSTGNSMTIRFKSDYSIEHSGWTAVISCNGTSYISNSPVYNVLNEGTYTVNLYNVCANASSTINIEHENYPLPNISYLQGVPMCTDSVLILDPNPGYTYETYSWSTGETTPTISISGLTTGIGQHVIDLTVTQGACIDSIYGVFEFLKAPLTPQLCVVYVDTNLNKNVVAWTADYEPWPGDPTYSPITHYNIYKATSGWQLIGSAPINQSHFFVDQTSSPSVVSALYKISAVNDCGLESGLSYYHKTILLAVTQGANPGEIPLIWNAYEDESGVFDVDQYYIFRGDSSTNMSLLDSISGYLTSYIDTGVYSQKYYKITANLTSGCNTAPAKSTSGEEKIIITSIGSNITNNQLQNLEENDVRTLTLYPNPATNQITISGIETGGTLRLYDLSGKLLLERVNRDNTLELVGIAAGSYVLECECGSGVVRGILVVE